MSYGTYKIIISVDNEAFSDNGNGELCRLLHEIAERVRYGEEDIMIHDINGNTVGSVYHIEHPLTIRNAARVIMNDHKLITTAYGRKTVDGIADMLESITD